MRVIGQVCELEFKLYQCKANGFLFIIHQNFQATKSLIQNINISTTFRLYNFISSPGYLLCLLTLTHHTYFSGMLTYFLTRLKHGDLFFNLFETWRLVFLACLKQGPLFCIASTPSAWQESVQTHTAPRLLICHSDCMVLVRFFLILGHGLSQMHGLLQSLELVATLKLEAFLIFALCLMHLRPFCRATYEVHPIFPRHQTQSPHSFWGENRGNGAELLNIKSRDTWQ